MNIYLKIFRIESLEKMLFYLSILCSKSNNWVSVVRNHYNSNLKYNKINDFIFAFIAILKFYEYFKLNTWMWKFHVIHKFKLWEMTNDIIKNNLLIC
jgi:hypothetical protein